MLKPYFNAGLLLAFVATLGFPGLGFANPPETAACAKGVCSPKATSQACPAAADREAAMLSYLDRYKLSDTEKQALIAFRNRTKAKVMSLHEEAHAKKEALQSYLKQPDANETEALSLQQAVNDVKARMGEARLKAYFEFKQLAPAAMQADLKTKADAFKKHHPGYPSRGSGRERMGAQPPEGAMPFYEGKTYKPEREWLAASFMVAH